MIPKPLEPDMVRVRWLSIADSDANDLARWSGMLDPEEQAKADRYVFASDRNTYMGAHALLRTMLSAATGLPTATWRYGRGPFGKPELDPSCTDSELRFNISHTRGFAACAIAHNQIGVDVEESDRRVDFTIADRFFAPEEARLVKAAPPEQKNLLFFRFWTLKEAFIKATGEGLRRPLDAFSFSGDPPRIAFHPERDDTRHDDNPDAWLFFAGDVAKYRPLALAVLRPPQSPASFDMRAASVDDV